MNFKLTLGSYFVLITLLFSHFSNAQNDQNQIDSTGNVGVGIMNPTHKLQVNGNTRIDSALEVRDTATFRRKVRIEEDVVILGKTFMRDNVVASENLRVQNGFRVDGISHFYNNVFVDSTFRVETLGLFNGNVRVNGQLRSYGTNNFFSTARFHDELRLLDLTDPSGQNEEGMMFLTGNGKVIRKEMAESNTIDSTDFLFAFDSNGNPKILPFGSIDLMSGAPQGLDCSGANYEPIWYNDVGKIWTGDPCDALVGIRTSDPIHPLDVRGITSTSKLLVGKETADLVALINGYRESASPAPLLRLGYFNSGQEEVRVEMTSGGSLVLNHEDVSAQWDHSPVDIYHDGQNIFKVVQNGGIEINHLGNNTQIGAHPIVVNYDGAKILQLESNGLLRAREIMVDLDNWPDYVFEKEYKLLSTDELRSYIDEHQHLPNVPSAREVEEEGVGLGELNKKLLEKVEELTLYMLQQQEEIENLKKEIEELKEGGE